MEKALEALGDGRYDLQIVNDYGEGGLPDDIVIRVGAAAIQEALDEQRRGIVRYFASRDALSAMAIEHKLDLEEG